MDFNRLYNLLSKYADTERAKKMSAYMKNQFSFLGIQTPQRRQMLKPLFDRKEDNVDWAFVRQCWDNSYREMQYAALDYLNFHKKCLTPSDLPRLKALALNKPWWDTIDTIAMLVGEIVTNNPNYQDLMLNWANDRNIWLRRIAIEHQLLCKEKMNTVLLENIITANLNQTEFFINKSIGWALRDYSKTDPAWVRQFIETHRGEMSELSIKEAGKYL